jgi:hypothetical protein
MVANSPSSAERAATTPPAVISVSPRTRRRERPRLARARDRIRRLLLPALDAGDHHPRYPGVTAPATASRAWMLLTQGVERSEQRCASTVV